MNSPRMLLSAARKAGPGWVPVDQSPLRGMPNQTVSRWLRKGLLNDTHVKDIYGFRFVSLTVTEELVRDIRESNKLKKVIREQKLNEEELIRRARAAVASHNGDTSRYDAWLKEVEA